jgi:adenosylmethionine-8-amino-7-oxononanoate aminotransferase
VKDTASLDRAHIWHPYTQHGLPPDAVPIAEARDALLFTTDGRPIVDAISSWWVTLHGHANPVIADAISHQARHLEQVIFAGFTHEPAARLAAELVERLPAGLTRVFFSDNGSTAVEVALKIALQYWQNRGLRRPLIAALDCAYHGDTFGAMSASAAGMFTAPFAEHLFEVIRLPAPSAAASAASDTSAMLAALDQVLEERADELAAVIVEPRLQGAGGMRMWDNGGEALRAIRSRTTAHDVLLIADEVLTGFGRTGPLFACAGAGVLPDIICLSKGLTGGFLPLGATVVGEPLFDAFRSRDRHQTFFHGHSYTANPLACAAARASLGLLDTACAQRRADLEADQRRNLARIAGHPWVTDPRVLGTIAAFDILPPTSLGASAGGGYLAPIGRELAAFALREGVLLRPLGNVVYAMPPYCITPEQLALVYDVIAGFLDDLDGSLSMGARPSAAASM